MKTFNRTSLPEYIKYNNKYYYSNMERTRQYEKNKSFNATNAVLVKVLPQKRKGRKDFHGKLYQPTVWIYTCQ
jgi:hypothetical protein